MTANHDDLLPSDVLHSVGVFEFSQAREVIVNALGTPEGDADIQGFEIVQLTSAEFALLPSFLMPQTFTLPLKAPVSIPGWAALASVIKGGCGLWRPYHVVRENLQVFAGDAQKRTLISGLLPDPFVSSYEGEESRDAWHTLINITESEYERSGNLIGESLVSSGLIRLQGLVWAAKWAAIVPEAHLDLPELARSLGVVNQEGEATILNQ